jgi:uncharacterized Zn finger protein (UPF0148 family)
MSSSDGAAPSGRRRGACRARGHKSAPFRQLRMSALWLRLAITAASRTVSFPISIVPCRRTSHGSGCGTTIFGYTGIVRCPNGTLPAKGARHESREESLRQPRIRLANKTSTGSQSHAAWTGRQAQGSPMRPSCHEYSYTETDRHHAIRERRYRKAARQSRLGHSVTPRMGSASRSSPCIVASTSRFRLAEASSPQIRSPGNSTSSPTTQVCHHTGEYGSGVNSSGKN